MKYTSKMIILFHKNSLHILSLRLNGTSLICSYTLCSTSNDCREFPNIVNILDRPLHVLRLMSVSLSVWLMPLAGTWFGRDCALPYFIAIIMPKITRDATTKPDTHATSVRISCESPSIDTRGTETEKIIQKFIFVFQTNS